MSGTARPSVPETLMPQALLRIKKDLSDFYEDPVDEIFLAPDDDNLTLLHALIVGPKDTPYEGGFFYFYLQFPANYPMIPPKVRLMTTGNGMVTFNPNLYSCGRVCLSILGTWEGPGWSPVLTMNTLLLSIQSLMNAEPYYNEPGEEGYKDCPESQASSRAYSADVKYNTLKIAVLDMVENSNGDSQEMPQVLKDIVKDIFFRNIDAYEKLFVDQVQLQLREQQSKGRESNANGSPGASSSFTYGADGYSEVCDYSRLKQRFDGLRTKLSDEKQEENAIKDETLYEALAVKYTATERPLPREPLPSTKDILDETNYYIDALSDDEEDEECEGEDDEDNGEK